MTPSIGRIVLVPAQPHTNNGAQVVPAVITRVWNDDLINVRVLGENTNTEWRTSVKRVDELPPVQPGLDIAPPLVWAWPPRV